MRLYLLRHGQSPSITEAKVATDAERPLSKEGAKDVAESARFIAAQGGRPALILHSPLLRAVQTAQEAAKVLKPAAGLETFLPLANVAPADELLKALRARLGKSPEALAVGHQPQLGELAAHLTGKVFELKPGGLIALEIGAEGAQASWVRNPPPPKTR